MMSKRLFLILATLIAAHTAPAMAADASNSLKIEAAKNPENKPKGQDIDTIITNNKMRAETGSKSKYSISTSLGYAGGSLNKPFDSHRPNITNGTGSTAVPVLGGSISGKYSLDTQNSVSVGIGARMIAPLEGSSKPKDYAGNKYDADNPSINLQHLYRWSGIQSSLNLTETFFTANNLTRQGYVTSWGLGQNNMYDIGQTGLSVGANTYVGLAVYNKHDAINRQGQSDYSWGFSPAVEYRLTDRLSLHTDSNLFIYEHLRSQTRAWTFRRQDVSQNFSFGYAVQRDIYISPGVSFIISDLRSDRTTWSLNANVNLF
jgi:hypothetical protein